MSNAHRRSIGDAHDVEDDFEDVFLLIQQLRVCFDGENDDLHLQSVSLMRRMKKVQIKLFTLIKMHWKGLF